MEIYIWSVDIPGYEERMIAMSNYVETAMKNAEKLELVPV